MSRRMEAPVGHECPYRHACPHLEGMACAWVMEEYQDAADLRLRMAAMEAQYDQGMEALTKAVLERDQKIAQLQVQHRKHFKANQPPPAPIKVKIHRRPRGAPVGHPAWQRPAPDHIDKTIHVPAPDACPRCRCEELRPCGEVYEHVQEDIQLIPHTVVTRFVHRQCYCPKCRRAVYQTGEGEVRNCQIGPVARALGSYLRYVLQIPHRHVQQLLGLFGMKIVPATALNFDRRATRLGRPLYEELLAQLKSSPVVYADETSWREDGQGRYLWFGGNKDVAVYLVARTRSSEEAVKLLGDSFDGTLVTDDYQAYNAVNAKHQQTCWNHIRTRAKDILQMLQATPAPSTPDAAALPSPSPVAPPTGRASRPDARSLRFCQDVRRFAARMCNLGRRIRRRKLSLRRAKAMIPRLWREVKSFASRPLKHKLAETLRVRLMVKDQDKLFTFLRVKGVDPTNNHSEQSVRAMVIMRKICFGTRSAAGSESHSVMPSLLQTARRQGKDAIDFLTTLHTSPLAAARAALFAKTSLPPRGTSCSRPRGRIRRPRTGIAPSAPPRLRSG